MKKFLSVILAAVLICLICVPAFAGTIDINSDPQKGTTTVKVDTSNMPENGTWEVKFPAEVSIEWGAASTTIPDYEITTHLKVGKRLTVTVTKADNTLTYLDKELKYSLSGQTSVKTDNEVINAQKPSVSVNITQTEWNNAPIAEYQGNLTFAAEVVDA